MKRRPALEMVQIIPGHHIDGCEGKCRGCLLAGCSEEEGDGQPDNSIEQVEARLRRRTIQRSQWLADSLRVLADWVERKPSENEEINYVLLQELHECDPDLPTGVGEVLTEALAVQHMLDLIGIPLGAGYAANIDARVYLAARRYMAMQERLARLAAWHVRETGPVGMVGGFCIECGEHWLCSIHRMAGGTY